MRYRLDMAFEFDARDDVEARDITSHFLAGEVLDTWGEVPMTKLREIFPGKPPRFVRIDLDRDAGRRGA